METRGNRELKLRLYKTPYIDPMFPNLVRLLFEGKLIENSSDSCDFYMYVWLDRLGVFKGFQAVLDNRITLAYHMSSKRFFGKMAKDLIDRGITKTESPEERAKLLSAINIMANDDFTALLDAIKKLAQEEPVVKIELSEGEAAVFNEICKNQ